MAHHSGYGRNADPGSFSSPFGEPQFGSPSSDRPPSYSSYGADTASNSVPLRDTRAPFDGGYSRQHAPSQQSFMPTNTRQETDGPHHPSTRKIINPDSPISILVIGPSQNGKTTFINRLIAMSPNENISMGQEGNKNGKCTVKVSSYHLDLPVSDWMLVDKDSRREVDVPDLGADEERVLGTWKKMTAAKYAVTPVRPDAPYLRVCLYDSPGLDDSEGKDFENMDDVLSTLNRLSKSDKAWERNLHAIVLVYNSNNAFSDSFQKVIKHYHDCMPNLFGGLAVINTHFDLATLSQKRIGLIRGNAIKAQDNARRRVVADRAKSFQKLLGGQGFSPRHFFLDNKPKANFVYADMLSRNTIAEILAFWRMTKPMPITQMRLIKSEDMMTIDTKLQRWLQIAITAWSDDLTALRNSASDREAFRSEMQQLKEELQNTIESRAADLARYDNDTQYDLHTHNTDDDASAAALFFKGTLMRQTIERSYTISEPNYYEFSVSTENNSRGRWVGHTMDQQGRKWIGRYEGKAGKLPNLVAKSYTTNRVHHRDRISELKKEKRKAEATLAEKEVTWAMRFSSLEDAKPKTETDKTLEEMVTRIETAKKLFEVLGDDSPPIDTSYDSAARTRYRKLPSEVVVADLLEFVKASEPEVDLVKHLRRELGDYD